MSLRRILVLAACLLLTTAASAVSPQRTFVASYGLDTSPTCSLSAPCRSFQVAIDAVAAGGEVVALDSAGYGAMEIHKSVSVIVPTGVHAGLSPSTGIPLPGYPGQYGVVLIDIQDTDVVVLRGLNVNHQGTLTGGIEWISAHGGTVQIENAVVNGFPKEGVYVQAPSGTLLIKDSIFRNNTVGIYASAIGYGGSVNADRVRIENSASDGVRLVNVFSANFSSCSFVNNVYAIHLQAVDTHTNLWIDKCNIFPGQASYSVYKLEGSLGHNANLQASASTLVGGASSNAFSTRASFGNNAANGVVWDVVFPPQ